jgi:predicted PurR-regulated permease PerM
MSGVVVKHDSRTVAEFPLTAGVVGAVIAPVLAALVAVTKDCTIEIERIRDESAAAHEQPPVSAAKAS